MTSPASFLSSKLNFSGKSGKQCFQKNFLFLDSKKAQNFRLISPELLVLLYLNLKIDFENWSDSPDLENEAEFGKLDGNTRREILDFQVESFSAELEFEAQKTKFEKVILDLETFIFSNFLQRKVQLGLKTKILQFYMSRLILKYFSKSAAKNVSKSFLTRLLRKKIKPAEFIFVDCRTPKEFKNGHLLGALNITNPEVLFQLFFGFSWESSEKFVEFVRKLGNKRLQKAKLKKLYTKYKRTQNLETLFVANEIKSGEKGEIELADLDTRKSDSSSPKFFRNPFDVKSENDDSELKEKLSEMSTQRNKKNDKKIIYGQKNKERLILEQKIEKNYKTKQTRNRESCENKIRLVFYCDGISKRSSRMLKYFQTNENVLAGKGEIAFPELCLISEGFASFKRKFEWFCGRSADSKAAPGILF